jgi:hypothetical protein
MRLDAVSWGDEAGAACLTKSTASFAAMARPLKAKRFTSAPVPYVLMYVRAKGKDVKGLEKKYH